MSKKAVAAEETKTVAAEEDSMSSSSSVVSESVRPWADLPLDILQNISEQVPAHEFIRFQNVCKSWKLVKPSVRVRPHALIWAVGGDIDDPRWRSGYLIDPQNPNETSEVQFPPALSGRDILGTCYGWLVTMKPTELADHFQCRLINVFTGACIELPIYHGGGFPMIWSSTVPSDPQCIFLMTNTVTTCPDILFCKQGDEEWRITGCVNPFMLLPVFHLNPSDASISRHLHYSAAAVNERFYILETSLLGNNGSCIDVISSPATITRFGYNGRPLGKPNFHRYHFLVESKGELLLVFLHREGDQEHEINNIDILRFDFHTMAWMEVTTIGDQVLFLGMNGSFSHSSSELGWSRGDYIFYPLYGTNGIGALWDIRASVTIDERFHDVITAKHEKTNWAWVSSSLHDSDGLATNVTEASRDNGNGMAGNSTEVEAIDND